MKRGGLIGQGSRPNQKGWEGVMTKFEEEK